MTTNKEVDEAKSWEILIRNEKRLAGMETKINQLETKFNHHFEILDAKLNWLVGLVIALIGLEFWLLYLFCPS